MAAHVALATALLGRRLRRARPARASLASVSLATRRRVWQIVLVGVVGDGRRAWSSRWSSRSRDSGPWWVNLRVGLAFTVAMLVWGMYLGSRRELLWTLRDRAERAEAEQALRVEQGRSNERARIAREMHDVLAHRISLITMHAGALAYRTDLTADEMRETAELIQAKSHEALTDLRQVLGVLRDGEVAAAARTPAADVRRPRGAGAEAEESGMHVQYVDRVDDAATMPDQVGRTTYRIVQEGLTNARKHAPGVTVLVRLERLARRDGVDIAIRNPARSRVNGTQRPPHPGRRARAGRPRRARQAGRRPARRRRRSGGSFELQAWLPWTPVTPATERIRVLVVDDDALVRSGLVMILGGARGHRGRRPGGRRPRRRRAPPASTGPTSC